MGKKVFAMLAAVFLAVTFMPAMASADLKISNSGWLGTVEGFEGIVPGSTNTSALYNGSWFNINITPPYNFGNGANVVNDAVGTFYDFSNLIYIMFRNPAA